LATGANINLLGFAVNFHFYLVQVGIIGSGSFNIGVAYLIAGHFCFTANSTLFRHNLPPWVSFIINYNIIAFKRFFGKYLNQKKYINLTNIFFGENFVKNIK